MPGAQAAIANMNNVLTATQANRQKKVWDQWDDQHVFLFFLNRMGGMQSYDGGPSIQIPLGTAKSTTVGTRGVNDPVPLTKKERMRPAEFVSTVLSDASVLNFFEMGENVGPGKIIDLWDFEQAQTLKSMQDEFNRQALQGVGAGNDFGGLPLIVSGTPTTGTVGGINRATAANAFWRNQVQASVGSFATNGLAFLRSMRNLTNKGSLSHLTTLNITTSTVFNAYELTQSATVRYQRPLGQKAADAGFQVLQWMDQAVAYDEAVNAGLWYMINFENFGFRYLPGFKFTNQDIIKSEAQFSQSQKIATFGNFVTTRPNNLGVGTDITA
jgi:hypothetical protein